MVTGPERVAFLRLRDAFARQRRAGHAGIEHRVAFLLEPEPQLRHLRGTAHRVRPFDHDELARKVRGIHAGQRVRVGFERLREHEFAV